MIVKFWKLWNIAEKKSRRNRECCVCNKTINKGEKYFNSKYRYDKTIISLYNHLSCKS